MSSRAPSKKRSGQLKAEVAGLLEEIRELYCSDLVPWVVGYSGGKDSTAVLQLVWMALRALPEEKRTKPVHVISTDTMVENPIVAAWVAKSLKEMEQQAKTDHIPVIPHPLKPKVKDSFWTCLIGKGYPSPRHKFRWCTYRLKILPSNTFIREIIQKHGAAILCLGIRKAESSKRSHVMSKLEKNRVRERLSPNSNLPNCDVYSPIESWSNDDVWMYLMQYANAWGYDNKQLLNMYRGASADGECPLVVDAGTPSCGASRFGCWVCTLVDKDRSMAAMIQNDQEKEWMLPLLALRDKLGNKDDHHLRDFRRLRGNVELFNDAPIRGPYTPKARAHWLRLVLEAQEFAREHGPKDAANIEFITLEELIAIRHIWYYEKRETEDVLPGIYKEVTGEDFPEGPLDENRQIRAGELQVLKKICGDDELHYELIRGLLAVEETYRAKIKRAGLYEELTKVFKRCFYKNEADATERATRKRDAINAAREVAEEPPPPYEDEEPAEPKKRLKALQETLQLAVEHSGKEK